MGEGTVARFTANTARAQPIITGIRQAGAQLQVHYKVFAVGPGGLRPGMLEIRYRLEPFHD